MTKIVEISKYACKYSIFGVYWHKLSNNDIICFQCYVCRYFTIFLAFYEGGVLLRHLFSRRRLQVCNCSMRIFILAFLWIASIAMGMYVASDFKEANISFMHSVVLQPISIAGLSAILLLPLFISIIALWLEFKELICILCCLRGFVLGYCLIGILQAFGSSGWLICAMLLFSNFACSLFLFTHWLNSSFGVISFLISAAIIGCTDYFLISPYLVYIINLQ